MTLSIYLFSICKTFVNLPRKRNHDGDQDSTNPNGPYEWQGDELHGSDGNGLIKMLLSHMSGISLWQVDQS